MEIYKRNKAFSELYRNRHSLYLMYINSISVFNNQDHIDRLSQVIFELVGVKYDLNEVKQINEAISILDKFRKEQKVHLTKFINVNCDYKKEYNNVISTLIGLRYIEIVRYGVGESSVNEILEYELDESNPDGRAIKSLRIAEVELTKTLYEIANNRFKCEAICKVTKSIINKLHRRRASLQRPR